MLRVENDAYPTIPPICPLLTADVDMLIIEFVIVTLSETNTLLLVRVETHIPVAGLMVKTVLLSMLTLVKYIYDV